MKLQIHINIQLHSPLVFPTPTADLIADMLHPTWKLGHVGLEGPLFVSSDRPAVIEDHIVVSQIPQAQVHYFLGRSEEQVLTNFAAESVPVIL